MQVEKTVALLVDIPAEPGKIYIIKGVVLVAVRAGLKTTAVAEANPPRRILDAKEVVVGIAEGEPVKRPVHDRGRGGHPLVAAQFQVCRGAIGGGPAADGEPNRAAADVVPVDIGAVNPQDGIIGIAGGGPVKVAHVAGQGEGSAAHAVVIGIISRIVLHAPGLVHGQTALELDILRGLGPQVQTEAVGPEGVVGVILGRGWIVAHVSEDGGPGAGREVLHQPDQGLGVNHGVGEGGGGGAGPRHGAENPSYFRVSKHRPQCQSLFIAHDCWTAKSSLQSC